MNVHYMLKPNKTYFIITWKYFNLLTIYSPKEAFNNILECEEKKLLESASCQKQAVEQTILNRETPSFFHMK